MSDQTPALPSPEAAPRPAPRPPRRQHNLVWWIYGLGFIVLAFAVLWIWQNPNPEALRPSQITDLVNEVTNLTVRVEKLEARENQPAPDVKPLQEQIAALTQRVNTLSGASQADLKSLKEQVAGLKAEIANAPKPASPDLKPIEQQITALKAQLATLAGAGSPSAAAGLTDLHQQVAALQQQIQQLPPPPNLQPLQSDIAGLQKQVSALSQLPAQVQAAAQQQQAMAQRLDSLANAQQDLGKRLEDLGGTVKSQEASFNQKLAAMQQQAEQLTSVAKSTARLARIESARFALSAGRPLGAIEGAPPALARFADTPPPTMAELRLSFPDAAKAALTASGQPASGASFGQRVLDRAQGLVTVREGDRVLVGNPDAGLLATAQTDLDAGDLNGAVAEVSKLTGPAAQAMAPWLDKAKALLAAEDALNAMAAHG